MKTGLVKVAGTGGKWSYQKKLHKDSEEVSDRQIWESKIREKTPELVKYRKSCLSKHNQSQAVILQMKLGAPVPGILIGGHKSDSDTNG